MNLTEILKKCERIAPVSLSDEFCKKYSMYDNSGIIIDSGTPVNGALFSLDLSVKAVEEALARGFELIVTHHPAIYGGISRLGYGDAVTMCVRHGISVISMHLNFDVAPKGIDYHLMRGLGGKEAAILAEISGGGYGRVYNVENTVFGEYLERIKKTFGTPRALGYGANEREVKRVASFCGAGCDEKAIAFAAEHGADVFVSSDMKHHEITALLHRKINVIHMTHYSAENYGFNKIYNELSDGLEIPSAYYVDAELM